MKVLAFTLSTTLLLLITACSTTQATNKPHFSPEQQQAHSKESLHGL